MLQQEFGLRLSSSSHHFENETLYWTKAASVLGLEQMPLPFSEVPLPPDRAARSLRAFLAENAIVPPDRLTRQALEDAFASLCISNAPAMLEKSPHHLYERAALDLICDFAQSREDVRVKFLGLVRHPVETSYSAWRRFGILPWVEEACWVAAYTNLLDLKRQMPNDVHIVHYRQLVTGQISIDDLSRFLELPRKQGATTARRSFDAKSLNKWQKDPAFGYAMSAEAKALALELGYTQQELAMPDRHWPVLNTLRHVAFMGYHAIPQSLRQKAVRVYRKVKRR